MDEWRGISALSDFLVGSNVSSYCDSENKFKAYQNWYNRFKPISYPVYIRSQAYMNK